MRPLHGLRGRHMESHAVRPWTLSLVAARAHGARGYLRQLGLPQFVSRVDESLFLVAQTRDGSDQGERQATQRVV